MEATLSGDATFLQLYRRLGELRDVATAERLLAHLKREQGLIAAPQLDPKTKLGEVDFKAYGFDASWWGRVLAYAFDLNVEMGVSLEGPVQIVGSLPVRPTRAGERAAAERLSLAQLAEPFRRRQREGRANDGRRDCLPDSGAFLDKIDRLLRAAEL